MKKLLVLSLSILAVGLFLTACGSSGNGGGCTKTSDCASQGTNYFCNLQTKQCECAPACNGKCCGDDGCGGTCTDTCSAGKSCNQASCECEDDTTCTAGQTRCNGNLAEACVGGAWTTDEDCAATGATCVNGVCQGGSCTSGTSRCNGNVVENCVASAWTTGTNCATNGEVCVNGACEAGGNCTDGNTRCNGNVIQTCNANNWTDGTNCANDGKVCSAGACIDQGATHPGAGDACKCEAADSCSIPCPADAGSAAICIITDDVGNGFCSFDCTTSPDCVADFAQGCCLDVGDGMACLPFDYCPGTNVAGDPCEVDINGDGLIVNEGTGHCTSDLACLSIDADPVQDPCGAVGDCTFQDNWNPDCVGGGCGASFCSAACDQNGGCLDGFDPITTGSGACYCAPAAPTGNSGPGDPCPFGNVNPNADPCQVGLTCLSDGSSVSFCSYTCASDPDCTTDFPGGCCIDINDPDPPTAFFCLASDFCG